jgi:two-component system LytT family response regulator
MKVLIIDDEFQSRKLIAKMLSLFFPALDVAGEAATVQEALLAMEAVKPQLIFLDVQMNNENGFELLDKVTGFHFEIIFITAHHEFAVKAFRYNALDYLMKPIDPDEFQSAVKKAIKQYDQNKPDIKERIGLLQQQLQSPNKFPDRVVIPSAEGYLVIPVQEIIYCHSNGNYTEFQLINNKRITSSYTMGHFEELLTGHNFFRVHRSSMINLAFVKMYKKGEGGSVIMNNGYEIEVSRSNKEAFMKLFRGQ